jgi:hypothetical protein
MIEYLLTPLDTHYDLGFGATANAFKESADNLSENSPTFSGHIPVWFLRRHAIELYLKSGIIIFHRKFELPYGADPPNAEPKMPISNEWKSLYSVHSIQQLFDYWYNLYESHREVLSRSTNTNWSLPCNNLQKWIRIIDGYDPGGDFFRYPVTKDRQRDRRKSSSRRTSVGKLIVQAKSGNQRVRAIFVTDHDDNVVASYQLHDDPENDLSSALAETATLFYAIHAAMRGELTGGW